MILIGRDVATSNTSFLGSPDLMTFAFLMTLIASPLGFPCWLRGREPTYKTGDTGDVGSIPGSGRSPWRRKWQPTPAFSPGESHGQRSLAGYSPWGHKESDTTEQLNKNKKQSSSDQHVVLGLRARGLQLDQ